MSRFYDIGFDGDDFNMERNFNESDRFEDMLDALWDEYLNPEPIIDELPEDWQDWLTEPSDEEMEIINQSARELEDDLSGWNDFLENLS